MSTLTPNMNLTTPTIGVDSGLTWEQAIDSNYSILDSHNHAIGSGVQITPSGMNINADLPINQNNVTALRSARFFAYSSPLSAAADLGCLYVSGVDLYYNDENGNQIQITAGGSVNATSSGISSGTATASFTGSTLVVNAASSTPANIQCASLLIGNTGVSGSKYCTLSPPSSLASNYALYLPLIPAQTNVMTIDSSGNMSSTTWNQVAANMSATGADSIAATMDSTGTNSIISTMGASGANSIANNRTRAVGSGVGVGGVAISSNINTSGTNGTDISVAAVTITTSGRPIFITLSPSSSSTSGTPACIGASASSWSTGGPGANFSFYNFSSTTYIFKTNLTSFNSAGGGTNPSIYLPPGTMSAIWNVGAGTYEIALYANNENLGTGNEWVVYNCVLVAYEL